ncbi:MAG: hypothetical protein Q8R10_07765 [Pseudomonas sp.]|uniref:hypothetical protein n=1 Tax=Pseudomonas sp. TaxID=306 RepID=UPI0027340FCB|nr:hypothetical protein [Pseudomonas sp.]MDP3846305.1 hypothetical protein [Pseudomonas sp.]
MTKSINRWRAFALHLLLSSIVFVLLALVVLFWFFPGGLFFAAGGWEGLRIILAVDLVLGPCLTLIVIAPLKPRLELIRDLSLIVLLQILALVAGCYIVTQARPLAVVYVFDTFYVSNRESYRQLDVEPQILEGFSGWTPKFFYVEVPSSAAEFLAQHTKALLNGEKPLQLRVDLYREMPVDRQALEKILHSPDKKEEEIACVRVAIESAYRSGSVCFDLDARKVRDFIPDGKG